MRRIGPYKTSTIPTFDALVAESTEDRRKLLEPLSARVAGAVKAYAKATPSLHTLSAVKVGKDEKAALIDGYDGRTAAMKRRLGKMLASLPPENVDLCPYCALDTNPDLDHFLPKASYPEFSLHGNNLIPICTPCNRRKLNAVVEKGTTDRLFLYASLEPADGVFELKADLDIAGAKLTVTYRIDGPDPQTADLELVQRHFKRLNLASRYSRRAQSHLAALKLQARQKSNAAVAKALQASIDSAGNGEPENGWRPALFRTVDAEKAAVLAWLSHRRGGGRKG